MINTIQKRQRLITVKDEAIKLEKEIMEAEMNCDHDFTKPISDPLVRDRVVFSHYQEFGSDPNPIYKKDGVEQIPRWSRLCKNCGKIEFTTKLKPAADKVPDFS